MKSGTALPALMLLAVSLGQAQLQPTFTITTVAGTGTNGFEGDGGQAVSAALNFPQDLVLDSDGSLYIADCFNQRIRKIAADGTISTVAGNGSVGFSRDSIAASSATFSNPCNIALDRSGGLYIGDATNHAVRRWSGGNVTTVAGNGTAGFSGDNAAARDALLNLPLGMVADSSGNLYFTDSLNNRIRKIASDGKISTLAGGAPGYLGDGGAALDARFTAPRDLALDSAGNLYVADTFNHRIRKIAVDGTVSTVAGGSERGFAGDGGLATKAKLNYPQGVAVDARGNIYIADTANNRIRMVTEDGIIATIGGSGSFGSYGDGVPAKTAQLRFPSGIVADSGGNVWITDDQNSRIRKLTRNAAPATTTPSIERVIMSKAFGGASAVAPGSWVEIYGTNLASVTREWTPADFDGDAAPVSLDGVYVTIGGVHANVAFISPAQVNIVIPSDAAPGEQEVVLMRGTASSAPYRVQVKATQPGLFAPADWNAGGTQYVAALLPDQSTYVLPGGVRTDVPSRPAHKGETITLYGTGFGSVTPYVKAGDVPRQATWLNLPVRFSFGDIPATVSSAGLVPGTIGLYRFDVVVPNVESRGPVELKFSLDAAGGEQKLYTVVED